MLKLMNIPIDQINREKGIPVLVMPQFYCLECGRILEVDTSEIRWEKIMVRGCGVCSPFEWYKIMLTDIQTGGLKLADKDWSKV